MSANVDIKDPMKPSDPEDVFPGIIYAVVCWWQELQGFLNEYGSGRPAMQECETLGYAHTLGDARHLLGIEGARVEREKGVALRPSSRNRLYGSDGEVSYELVIRALPDEK